MKHMVVLPLLGVLLISACAPVDRVAVISTDTPAPRVPPTSMPLPTSIPLPARTPTSALLSSTPTAPLIQPTATPDLNNFRVETWSFTSPDGKWKAQVIGAFPVAGEADAADIYYTQLKVSSVDGVAEWVVVDEWSEWGLGYTIPYPLHWSHNGRYLYITNKPVPDGCAVFVNGSDLRRVDLSTGKAEEIVPVVGLWLSLSPDETRLAYIGYRDRGLVVRDLATGTERETKLNPGEEYQAGHIIWSPDGRTIVLALALQPCSTDWADATSIIRVDVATLEQKVLLQRSKQLLVPVEWTTADKVLLKDKDGNDWLMDITTGQVTRK